MAFLLFLLGFLLSSVVNATMKILTIGSQNSSKKKLNSSKCPFNVGIVKIGGITVVSTSANARYVVKLWLNWVGISYLQLPCQNSSIYVWAKRRNGKTFWEKRENRKQKSLRNQKRKILPLTSASGNLIVWSIEVEAFAKSSWLIIPTHCVIIYFSFC